MSKYIKIGTWVFVAVLVIGWLASIQFDSQKNTYSGLPTAQQTAPRFKLKSIQGDTISLSQFKGKLVYLKFWASWCGDCIKEVVPQRRIEEDLYSNSSVVFINISVDKDLDDWRKSVERNKLVGYELISQNGGEADVRINYGVHEIPRYILIGKDGKVIENNAPKPSEIDADYFLNFLK